MARLARALVEFLCEWSIRSRNQKCHLQNFFSFFFLPYNKILISPTNIHTYCYYFREVFFVCYVHFKFFSSSEKGIGINDVLLLIEGLFLTSTKYIAFFSFAIRNRFQVLTPSIKKCLSVALQWLWFMIVCNAFFLFSLIYDCLRLASYFVKKYISWAQSFT